jgi:pimeloyl-ACP methyl ester carboxylesterase
MKKVITVVAVVIALYLVSGCATTRVYDKVSYEGAPTVVIIGGAGSSVEPMREMQKAFPRSVAVVPQKYYPLYSAADVVLQQIREAGITGKLILVGHSWGGLIARTIDARNPGLVVAVVTIATPLDIRFMPNGLGDPFRPDDRDSKTPLYVVAGIKAGTEKKWWMRTDESDGVVDIMSAMNFAGRQVVESVIVRGENAEHSEIVKNRLVINQVQTWLNPGKLHLASAEAE